MASIGTRRLLENLGSKHFSYLILTSATQLHIHDSASFLTEAETTNFTP